MVAGKGDGRGSWFKTVIRKQEELQNHFMRHKHTNVNTPLLSHEIKKENLTTRFKTQGIHLHFLNS